MPQQNKENNPYEYVWELVVRFGGESGWFWGGLGEMFGVWGTCSRVMFGMSLDSFR